MLEIQEQELKYGRVKAVYDIPTAMHIKTFTYCEITFIRGVPIFMVFVGRLIHEIKLALKKDHSQK